MCVILNHTHIEIVNMATATTISPDISQQRHFNYSDTDSESEDEPSGLRSAVTVVQRAEGSQSKKRARDRSPSPRSFQRSPSPVKRKEKDSSGPMLEEQWVEKEEAPPETKKKKEELDPILTRTGGAYIPPARLRMLQEQISDKTSLAYQRMSWEALKKSINGLINKVNVSNISDIVRELFQENIVRGRGLLARSVITAQGASPTFTHVYACLVAIINTKFPQTGELIIKRLVIQFKKAFRRNDKKLCLSSVRFIAHLVNQQVIHELLALELLTLLLEDPTSDSVEVAVGFLKECGSKLTELSPRGVLGVFESLKGILHDGNVDIRVQYMIEVMFAIRKDKFKEFTAVVEGLDLIQEDDQITHLISLDDDDIVGEDMLNVFKVDSEFQENEDRYKAIKEEILGEGSSDEEGEASGSETDNSEEDEAEGDGEDGEMKIIDETQTDLMGLRRTIYLTIMSSLDFEECAHKLLKMTIRPEQEMEVANMIIECCSQERSYQRFYGLLGERFCHLNETWVEKFDAAFQEQYATVHRLEANKLRNVAKFFAQLFYTDAIPWTSLSCIHLNEDETNSSSRIFVKIMFQELAEYMGLQKLNERLKDPFLAVSFEGLLPRDNPRNTRFAINFFTSIGLGGLTDDLREHLKNAPKLIMAQQQDIDSDTSSSSSDESSDSSESSSEESSSSESEDSEKEPVKKRKAEDVKRRSRNDKERDRKHYHRDHTTESHKDPPSPSHKNKRNSPSSTRQQRKSPTHKSHRHGDTSSPSHHTRHRRDSPSLSQHEKESFSSRDIQYQRNMPHDSRHQKESSPPQNSRHRKHSPSSSRRHRDSPSHCHKDSPSRRNKDSPSHRNKDSPSRRNKDSPSRHHKDSPSRRHKDSPSRRHKDSPSRRHKDSPSRRNKDSPSRRNKDSPSRRNKDSPSHRNKDSPSRRHRDSPSRHHRDRSKS